MSKGGRRTIDLVVITTPNHSCRSANPKIKLNKSIPFTMKSIYIVICSLSIFWFAARCQPPYGVNDKTTEIGYFLEGTTLDTVKVRKVINAYQLPENMDAEWHRKLSEIKKLPFKTDVLYFEEEPEELIAVNFPAHCIRYLYNPEISNDVIAGMSSMLDSANKERIKNRIIRVLVE